MNCICSPCFRSIIICLSQKRQIWQEAMLRMLLCTSRKTLLQTTKMIFSAKNYQSNSPFSPCGMWHAFSMQPHTHLLHPVASPPSGFSKDAQCLLLAASTTGFRKNHLTLFSHTSYLVNFVGPQTCWVASLALWYFNDIICWVHDTSDTQLIIHVYQLGHIYKLWIPLNVSHKTLSNFNGYLYTHKCTKSCEVNHHSLDSEIAERPKFTSVCVLFWVPHFVGSLAFMIASCYFFVEEVHALI